MGTRELMEKCERAGIATSYIHCGKGSSAVRGRYRLDVNVRIPQEAVFVVQYCKDIDMYLAWDISRRDRPARRKVYTLSATAINKIDPDAAYHVEKPLGHVSYKITEWVLVFGRNRINTFIEECLQRINESNQI